MDTATDMAAAVEILPVMEAILDNQDELLGKLFLLQNVL